MRHRLLAVVPFLMLAACDGGGDAMMGNWSPEGEVAGFRVGLEFDGKGNKCMPHVDGPDGHGHPAATYTFDPASKLVTVKSKLLGDAKADTWTGTLAGDTLELTGGDVKLKFKKGGKAH